MHLLAWFDVMLAHLPTDEARRLEEESVGIWRELADKRNLGYSLNVLGGYYLLRRDFPKVRDMFREALDLQLTIGDRFGVSFGLAKWAAYFALDGDCARALRLLGTVHSDNMALVRRILDDEQDFYGVTLRSVRESLSDEAAATAWAEGQAMTLEQAAAEVLGYEEEKQASAR